MPRYGKKYKSFNGIIPSLELDITEICDGATSACELKISWYICMHLYIYTRMIKNFEFKKGVGIDLCNKK